jgi:ion channel-forming bestrophin family protein
MIEYDVHDWGSHLLDVKGSMVREIIGRVMTCVLWSALVVCYHHFVRPVSVPSTVHGLVGTALGLLLVFRTNSSYDRFWEGRRMWGGIVNETRNLARGACVHLKDDPALLGEVVRWTVAWAYASMHSLRGRSDLGPIAGRLPPDEVEAAIGAQHTPLAVATRISLSLHEAKQRGLISDYIQAALDQNVQLLIDYLGACERIRKTPLPFAYVVHLRRALILYCFTLPFALVEAFGWGTVLDTLLVAYVFFGIEEIGVEIEDPFGEDDNDLPVEGICVTIERNLMALLDEKATPARLDEIG